MIRPNRPMNGRVGRAGRRSRGYLPEGRPLPEREWRLRHRMILRVLILHVAGAFVYGLVQGFGFAHSALDAAPIAIAAVAAGADQLGRRLRSVVATLGLMTASAVLVHLSGGLIEFHFPFLRHAGRDHLLSGLDPVPCRRRLRRARTRCRWRAGTSGRVRPPGGLGQSAEMGRRPCAVRGRRRGRGGGELANHREGPGRRTSPRRPAGVRGIS